MQMSKNFKNTLLIIVAVLGVILIGLFFYENTVKEKIAQNENFSPKTNEEVELKLSEPSGDTDDIMSAAFSGIEAEAEIEKNEDVLAESTLKDEKEVSDFSTAYEDANF